MNKNQLAAAIFRHTTVADGRRRISCEQAHRLAAEWGAEVARIGEICQAEQIKITHCQLGCFGDRSNGSSRRSKMPRK
jgi:hypothetical protein